VDRYHLQALWTEGAERVCRPGGHHEHVPCHTLDRPAVDLEAGAACLDDERLGVRVAVQGGTLAGCGVDYEERDIRAVGRALEAPGTVPGSDRIFGMATTSKRRSYDDGCAAAHALDLIGERWALLVVRELLLGPKRFTDLRTGLPNASPNVLAQRLRELEVAGVVRRRKLPPPAASRVYELTQWGEELEAVIISLGRWGARSASRPREAELGVDSLILSFRTMFDARAARGIRASYELRLGEDRFYALVADGRFEVARGGAEGQPDAIIQADAATLAALVYGGRQLEEALRAGDIEIEGDESAVERFVGLFPLPEPAASTVGG
jgi:DNA-binding HxlR family transcriptional regulator